jgi:Transcriptional regulators
MNYGRLNDDIDRQLLALLISDARRSTASLAKDLGLARTTVHERIKRLERSGMIAGYTALSVAGFESTQARAIVLVSIDLKEQRRIIEQIERLPEVVLCATVNGEFDLLLELRAPLNEDIDAVIDEIIAKPGVKRIQTLLFLSTRFDRRRPSVAEPRRAP